jgi:hypothetical protein
MAEVGALLSFAVFPVAADEDIQSFCGEPKSLSFNEFCGIRKRAALITAGKGTVAGRAVPKLTSPGRIQPGKLDVLQSAQAVSCKTGRIRTECDQGVTSAKQNLEFEPLEHSVYHGRQRLGRYVRIAARRYAAYDARNRLLGKFKKRKDAWAAIGRASAGAAQ